MARKPSDIVSPNLRIREDLRRQLEKAATANGVSINREMINRLEASFGQQSLLKLDEIARNQEVARAKLDNLLIDHRASGELESATAALIAQIALQDPKAIAAAAAEAKLALEKINQNALARRRWEMMTT